MTETRTVLLVDDDPSFRRVMEYQLREDGYQVFAVPNGATALQRFQAERVDVVLTDVKMPESDGMDLLTRLKILQPDLPVVMLTAHGTIGTAVDAMKRGAFDYLTKPVHTRTAARGAEQDARRRCLETGKPPPSRGSG